MLGTYWDGAHGLGHGAATILPVLRTSSSLWPGAFMVCPLLHPWECGWWNMRPLMVPDVTLDQ